MDARADSARVGGGYGLPVDCPCCRRPIPYFDQLRVYRPARVAMRRGRAAVLTPRELRILITIMESRTELNRHTLTERVFADDPTGGPENALISVSVGLYRLKRKLLSLGVEIKSYSVVCDE